MKRWYFLKAHLHPRLCRGEWGGRIFVLKPFEKYSVMLFSFCFWICPASSPFHWCGLKRCWIHPAYSEGNSPCTCFFLLLKISHKGIEGEQESSQLFLLITISSVSGIFLHYWLCHMISCRSPVPLRIFPRLEACHPPASCFMTENKSVFLFWGGYLLVREKKCFLGSSKREQSHEIGIFEKFLHQTKAKNFPNSTGRATKEK